jgi:hypothetical protein
VAQYDKPCPGVESAIYNAISTAEKIMAKIDEKHPAKETDKAPYNIDLAGFEPSHSLITACLSSPS